MKNTPIGIDTLHLNPVEWHLSDDFHASIGSADYDSKTGVFTGRYPLFTVSGETHYGAKAYKNLTNCNLELKPYTERSGGTARVSAKITITVPKIFRDDNYFPADGEQLRQALFIVESELRDEGFQCSVTDALVKRADAARTWQALDRWESYKPVVGAFNPSRMTSFESPTGHRWSNGLCQLELYEKGRQLAAAYPDRERAAVYARYPANSFRAELRLMKCQSFQNTTGMKTAGDLLSDFSHFQDVFRKEFEKRLFRSPPAAIESFNGNAMSVEQTAADMMQFVKNDQFKFVDWMHADWARHRLANPKHLEIIQSAVKVVVTESGRASQNIAKKQRLPYDLYVQYGKPDGAERTVADLYNELRDKTLAA